MQFHVVGMPIYWLLSFPTNSIKYFSISPIRRRSFSGAKLLWQNEAGCAKLQYLTFQHPCPAAIPQLTFALRDFAHFASMRGGQNAF